MKKLLLFFLFAIFLCSTVAYGAANDVFWGFELRESKEQAVKKANDYGMKLDYSTKGLLQTYMFINGDLLNTTPNMKEVIIVLYFYNDKLIDTYFNFSFTSEDSSKDFFGKLKDKYKEKYGIIIAKKKDSFVIKQKSLVISSIFRIDSEEKSSVLFSASDNDLIKEAKKQIQDQQTKED